MQHGHWNHASTTNQPSLHSHQLMCMSPYPEGHVVLKNCSTDTVRIAHPFIRVPYLPTKVSAHPFRTFRTETMNQWRKPLSKVCLMLTAVVKFFWNHIRNSDQNVSCYCKTTHFVPILVKLRTLIIVCGPISQDHIYNFCSTFYAWHEPYNNASGGCAKYRTKKQLLYKHFVSKSRVL
jgi:hypothetical protein